MDTTMKKQTVEQRRAHHQTREDRQLKALEVLERRIKVGGRIVRGHFYDYNTIAAERDAANLRAKLNLN